MAIDPSISPLHPKLYYQLGGHITYAPWASLFLLLKMKGDRIPCTLKHSTLKFSPREKGIRQVGTRWGNGNFEVISLGTDCTIILEARLLILLKAPEMYTCLAPEIPCLGLSLGIHQGWLQRYTDKDDHANVDGTIEDSEISVRQQRRV